MQIRRLDAHIRMPSRVADFGQRAVAGQCVADERVAAVVNCQRLQSRQSQCLTGSFEPAAKSVAREGARFASGPCRCQKRIVRRGAVDEAIHLPPRQIVKRPDLPPLTETRA